MALSYPLHQVIERLRAVDEIKLVGNAPELSAALASPPRSAPAVYLASSTRGGPIKHSGLPVQQGRTTSVSLVIWVRNHGNAEVARAEADAVLAAIDASLSGWSPANPPFGSLRLDAVRDEFSSGQHLVMQAIYVAEWNFSSEQP